MLGQRFEPGPVGLDHRDGNVARFPGLDVLYDAGFSRVHAADDFATSSVFQVFRWIVIYHVFLQRLNLHSGSRQEP